MSNGTIEDIVQELELLAADDYVGVWILARAVRTRRPASTHEMLTWVRNVSERLVERGLVLGQFEPGAIFEVWPSHAAVDRLTAEWSDLGRDPDIGEIAWFTTPD